MKDQFSPIMQRTRRWKFEAGTTELILGGVFFWAGIAILLPLLLHRSPMFVLNVFVLGLFFTGILVEYLQRRYINPRLGYVEYRENTRKGIWRLILLIVFSLMILGGIRILVLKYDPEAAPAWIAPMLAFIVAIVLIPYALQLRRLVVLGLISAALGLVFSPLIFGRVRTSDLFALDNLGFYFLVMGLVFFFSGACTFRTFLRQNPPPAKAPDEQ